jgi:cytochrome c oxidase accessory protein FixG
MVREVIPIAPADDNGLFSIYQAHQKLYPRAVTGRFARLRWGAVFFTQMIFYGVPWLQWNDRQAVLFDLGARKFYLFGAVLWPQDFVYLAALLVIAALSLFFFTAVAGRLWCGYACPQTVYTELFMWIERHTEGDRAARMKLDAGPWSAEKLARKGAKQTLWIALALLTGFTFIGYFAPIRELGAQVLALSIGPWQLFWLLFYSFATWGNAGFMREQVCKYMCPYARFQGAMFDRDTLVVTYDERRGEPRGSRSRKAEPAALGLGSCIDCNLCVQVCPTGIDIRQGQQYECIGCAACIDVCDTVMDKMGYAPGLVRYSTHRAVHAAPEAAADRRILSHLLRPRVLIYACLLGVLGGGLVTSIVTRNPLRVDVIRDRNTLARIADAGRIENAYRLNLMNASEHALVLDIAVEGIDGISIAGPARFDVAPASNHAVPVRVQVPPQGSHPGAHPIRFLITAREEPAIARTETASFIVPH